MSVQLIGGMGRVWSGATTHQDPTAAPAHMDSSEPGMDTAASPSVHLDTGSNQQHPRIQPQKLLRKSV